jgi:KDO2-lipid IV(A) lauroyltransferase
LHQKGIDIPFLQVSTSFFEGPGKLANRYNFDVFYQSVHEKNGKYCVSFHKIFDTGKIIKEFAQFLDRDIMENPYLWLWTHKRWKKNGVSYK